MVIPLYIYMFDVDDTLEISNGPIKIQHLRNLRKKGHVVGLCGNWAVFINKVPDWNNILTFIGPMEMTKVAFLKQIKTYVPAVKYYLIGNCPIDETAAIDAGWDFYTETYFGKGMEKYGCDCPPGRGTCTCGRGPFCPKCGRCEKCGRINSTVEVLVS